MATDNIALVRRMVEEVWNKGNTNVLGELLADNYVGNHPIIGVVRGIEGVKQQVQTFRTAFPDLVLSIDDIGMAGDRVFMRWTGRGTHRGVFMGVPSTNNKGQVQGISIDRFANGKLVEHNESYDSHALLQILGVVQPLDRLMKGAQAQQRTQTI